LILFAELPLADSALMPFLNHLQHLFASALALHKTFLCKAMPSAGSNQDGLVGWIRLICFAFGVNYT
jgi:hypothetical protein